MEVILTLRENKDLFMFSNPAGILDYRILMVLDIGFRLDDTLILSIV